MDKNTLQHVLTLSQGERMSYDLSKTWVDLFREQASLHPERTAVSAENGSFTYGELDRLSDRLAARLIAEGVERDSFVAVRMGRVKEFHLAALAIHKAGAAYMPIDLEYPEDRVEYMLSDSGAKLLLTEEKVAELLRADGDGAPFKPLCGPDSRAYMIYTSGSTGKPKGVVIQHHALTNFVWFIVKRWGLTPDSRIALHSNFAFDAAVEDLYPALSVGGTVFVVPESARKDIFEMRDYIARNHINGGSYSTQFGQLLCADEPLDVDYVCMGGEAMTIVPQCRGPVYNSYGPTEFTVDATYFELEKGREYRNIPIGRPLHNCAAYIVNDKLELLPPGEVGELCLSGPQLAEGYWNRPELTAEKFTDIRLTETESVKVYRTGDLARWNEEGQLEFCGRIDFQVKLRGFRIELGEVESCAARFPGIRQTAAEVRKSTLCLYYTASEPIDEAALTKHMAGSLAEYMVPGAFMKLETMPHNVNGKIDRKALPDPVIQSNAGYVAPETEVEKAVVAGMEEVMESADPIGVTHDFFELGGDSIRAIRLINLLRKAGYVVSVADLMSTRTAQKLAALMQTRKAESVSQESSDDSSQDNLGESEWTPEEFARIVAEFAARGETIRRIYPLTPMQEGMLLEHVTHPESLAYRLIDIYKCDRVLDEALLRHAIDALAERHETLRTAIIHKGVHVFRQAIVDRKLPLKIVDVSDSPDPFEAAKQIRFDILRNGYDLQNRPLTQFVYARTAEGGYLIFATHHIVTDGWCFDTLLRDLNALLRGEKLSGNNDGMYEKAVRELLARDRAAAVKHFAKTLEGYENSAVVPSWGETPKTERSTRDEYEGILSPEDVRNFYDLCRSVGATLADGFNLVWGMTLRTLNRLDDVAFTTIVSGRDSFSFDVSDLVGLFINPTPLRVNPKKGASARQCLKQLRQQVVESKPFDFCPLLDIQRAVGAKLGGFIVSFDNYNDIGEDATPLKLVLTQEDQESGSVGVNTFVKADGSVLVLLGYDPAYYREAEIARFFGLFLNYVKRMAASPDTPLDELSQMNADDRAEVLALSRGETLHYDASKTWVDLFREQASLHPERTAVSAENGSFTYGELDQLSDRLAARLIAEGVERDAFVAVRMGRVKEFHLAALAIHKAGAAYMPIDLEYPEDRVEYMLSDSGAKLLLTEEKVAELLRADGDGAPFKPLCGPDSRAYMIYTSGSTGKPKGVVIQHHALTNFVQFIANRWGLNPDSRIALHSNFAFDAAVEDLYPALTVGGTVFVVPESARKDIFEMRDYIARNHINGGCYSTQFGQLLGSDASLDVNYVCLGGEAMTTVPQCRGTVYNTYGPTEFTVDATYFELEKGREYRSIPIGRPLHNCAAYIVNDKLKLLPRGVIGELCLSGPQLAEGYWNRQELTAEKFTDIRLTETESVKVYRTGDLARWNEEGQLEFCGRIDFQVKLRGFRIELGEIENVAMSHPGVSMAAAEVRNQVLCLYYTEKPGAAVDVDALRGLCARKLADYMVPTAFMRLAEMPLTINGKVNRKALPAPEITDNGEVVEPETETERRLYDIAMKILGTAGFGVMGDLTTLGLSSISAMHLSAAIDHEFNRRVTVADILRTPTVRGLSEQIDGAAGDEANYALRESYPLSMTQMGIFTECMRFAGTTAYNIPYLYKLDDKIDIIRLRDALERVILAHPYLSMTLDRTAVGEVQAVRHVPERVDIPVLDTLPTMDKLIRPFDLISGESLCRMELYDTAEGKYLFMDIHHIAADGASLDILLEDLDTAYAGGAVQPESYTGFEFALDEQRARASERFAAAKAWYDGVCRGCESQTLPTREANRESDEKVGNGRNYGRTSAGAVRAFCEKHGLTLNAFFTTAFALALKAYTGSESAVFCTIYNGRSDPKVERSVSMFVKTLPVVLDCAADQSVAEAVAVCQAYLLGAMSHDIFSFAEIREAYGIESDVLFAYQGELTEECICGLPAQSVDLFLSQAKAAFGLDVFLDGDRVVYETEYDPALYGPYTMDGFVHMLDVVCGEMLTQKKLRDIRLTTKADEAAIINLHDTDFPTPERPAYRLLQDSAKKYPDRVAAIASNQQSLTYRELNAAANRMGNYLRNAGLGVDGVAGVMLKRGLDVYRARQGVLKAGGAFLPIDPTYPDDRVKFILEDSGAKHIVTSREIYQERKALLNGIDGLRVCLMGEENTYPAEDIDIDVPNDALAYCIYTSGSTGKPKGVMLTQKNLVNFVDANPKNREILGYTDKGGSVSLALAAMTFDLSIMEEFIPLAHGLTICMANEEEIHDFFALKKLCMDNGVDLMTCTPSFLTNLIDVPEMAPVIRQVKAIDFGAEAFPAALFGRLRAINPNLHIMNGYGPTEATISCTMEIVQRADDITIGIPNANVHVATLDRDGRLQPLGAMGEMVIMGDGVGRGYVNRADLTEKSFIRLLDKPAYRSGDLVRLREDGRIEFHGRIDNQVKLRGLRIELGEIEGVLNSYPGVKTSIVVVDHAAECLVAYFTADGHPEIEDVKRHLSSYLTAYMTPQCFMQLDEMPLTANGKIDKKALPPIKIEKAERVIVPPSTDLQRTLCKMFQKALEMDEVGVTESFFELGGTSLKASVVLISALMENLPIAYQDIFNVPTVEGLEKLVLERQGTESTGPELVEVRASDSLARNTNAYLDELEREPLGNVMLTGVTGFLGIHVLKELLDNTDEKVYCLVRRHKGESERELKGKLFYYFETDYEELFGSRLFVVEGDITQPDTLKAAMGLDYRTVINCAACVKHFADIEFMKDVNLRGVENLTALCLEKGARLIQISTVSVAGDTIGDVKEGQRLREDRLDIGQEVQSNGYVYTKYLAEKHVLTCMEEKGLDAKIIRMGNLSSRVRDGEFQMNFSTNAFMNSLRAYAVLGCYPLTAMSDTEEISYIDEAARTVVLLSGVNRPFTVFHAYNSHTVEMGNIISSMNALGIRIEVVKDAEFKKRLQAGLADDTINRYLSPLVNYSMTDDDVREEITAENFFTTNALYHLGFAWTITDLKIIGKMIESMKTLGFFDIAEGSGKTA